MKEVQGQMYFPENAKHHFYELYIIAILDNEG